MHPGETCVFVTTSVRCTASQTALILSPMLYGPRLIAFLKTAHKISATDLVRVTAFDLLWDQRHTCSFYEASETWNARCVERLIAASGMDPSKPINAIAQEDAFDCDLIADAILSDQTAFYDPPLLRWRQSATSAHLHIPRHHVCLVPHSPWLCVGLQDAVPLVEFEERLLQRRAVGIYGILCIEERDPIEDLIPFEGVVTMQISVLHGPQ